MYLIDTNVISISTPERAVLHAPLARWMDRQSGRLYLSVITIAEIEEGIARARRLGSTKKASALSEWLDVTLYLYSDRVLPVDMRVARVTGALSDQARSIGQTPGFPDIAIAATAQAHSLTILTRNIRHFASLGVSVHDPFESLPE